MNVIKRNGKLETLSFDKILQRIRKIGIDQGININYQSLTMKVIDRLYDKIPTQKIDEFAAEQCAVLSTLHPDYAILASHIIISNHQKATEENFYNVVNKLYQFKDKKGCHKPIVSKSYFEFTKKYKKELNTMIDYSRDYLIDYFGFKTLERAYLLKIEDKVLERPQHMWLRVSIAIHSNILNEDCLSYIKETYDLMSLKYFTHATPTLFNAGTPSQQLSSCYLVAMEDDSIEGIFNTLKECALISKYSGGIGLHIHNIRAKGSFIHGTNGITDGLVPMLKVFNSTARYVNQCFTPDTWVYSKIGPKQMCEVTTEDELVTIDGTFKKVNQIIKNEVNKYILEIRATNTLFPIKVTKEHQLYLIKNQKKTLNFSLIKNRLNQKIIKPAYYSANELNEDDLVGFAIPTYECDNEIHDLDYYKFYGMMLGGGFICRNKESGIALGVVSKYESIEFIRNYLKKHNIIYWESFRKNCISIKWSNYNNDKLNINASLLYNSDHKKQITTSYLHLPKNKILQMIEGLLKTDGSNLKELYFCNTSLNLIMQMRYLFLRLGILTSGNIKDHRGESHITSHGDKITTKQIYYKLRIPKHPNLSTIIKFKKNGKYFKYFEYDNMLWGRIKTINKIQYSGEVYDFNMIDNHNYLTDMGIVHNSGKRNGSFAIYLETWHPDIEEFLELKKNHGDEESKSRDLFYAIWTSDLFMERIEKNGNWSLFCPHECPGLSDVYGKEFNELYTKYENQGLAKKTIKARDLWFRILDAQMETGTPYILYKDASNIKSNQKNLGTIKSSNLCCEILEYSDKDETAVCNLASIALPTFVDCENKIFNYVKLHEVVKVVTNNLNRVIDINFYPTEKTRVSNLKHRPIGIGVQGLADVFLLLDLPYHSEEARELNRNIFETIYHAALEKSCEIAKERGIKGINIQEKINEYDFEFIKQDKGYYSSFEGSPASQGILQMDMWGVKPSDRYNWQELKERICKYGLRNSLLVAPMPTASTSQILGFNECFEPFTSNIYSRKTLAGEFIIVNKYLVHELLKLGYWNEDIKNNIIANKGSIQQLKFLPDKVREKYKIVWEIPMRFLIDLAVDRAAYICQSQSLNLWVEDPNYNILTSMHFYSWKKGLKTGIYYLRRKAKHQAQQFTIEPTQKEQEDVSEDPICEACSA